MRGSEPMPLRTCSMSAPDLLGQIGHLVHEADAGGQHGVGGVLGQLRALHVHVQGAVVVAVEGGVELRSMQGFSRGGPVFGADDDAVGPA